MRIILVIVIFVLVCSCNIEQVEEFAFRKTIEYSLVEMCEEESKDKECVDAIKAQIEACMEESDWRQYLENEDDKKEMNRFINRFYPCFKNSQGESFFEIKL